jgi:hypothetical protein
MTRHGTWLIAVVLAGGAAVAAPTGEIRVTTVVSDGRVLASFTVPSAWTTETRQLIRSGLLLTFSYDVELRRPSAVGSARPARACGSASSTIGTYPVPLRDGHVLQSGEPGRAQVRQR